ncbi:MAG: hypothetical protein IPI88_14040 [Chitinophagaceae bacterium]|nr:hypothetical protein [Chitinophagaceae bacterium]
MGIDIVPGDDLQLSNIATEQLPDLNNLLESAIKNHPELVIYNYKIDVLNVDKK